MAAGSSAASAAKTAMRGGLGNSTSGVRSGGGAVDENDVRREVELDAELRVPVMSGRRYSRSMWGLHTAWPDLPRRSRRQSFVDGMEAKRRGAARGQDQVDKKRGCGMWTVLERG